MTDTNVAQMGPMEAWASDHHVPSDAIPFSLDVVSLSELQVIARQQDAIRAEMIAALFQARGALLLDHMVDDNGEPFGTTTVALEAIDAVLTKAKAGA